MLHKCPRSVTKGKHIVLSHKRGLKDGIVTTNRKCDTDISQQLTKLY